MYNEYVYIFSNLCIYIYTEIVLGTNIIVTGDVTKKLSESHPTVIIMNHTSVFDWIYLLCVIQRIGSIADFKVIMDSQQSKNIPIFGMILHFNNVVIALYFRLDISNGSVYF